MKALADLKDMTEAQVKDHLCINYQRQEFYDNDGYGKKDPEIASVLKKMKVVFAYESVGSWGCDSSSWFLLKEKGSGKLFEVHGSHCSCYGFEGQFTPEETTIEALQHRAKDGWIFYCGGYDDDADLNKKSVTSFILKLK